MRYEKQVYYISIGFITPSEDKRNINYHIDIRKEGKEEYMGLILLRKGNEWMEIRYDNTKGYPDKFIQSMGKLISNYEEKIEKNKKPEES